MLSEQLQWWGIMTISNTKKTTSSILTSDTYTILLYIRLQLCWEGISQWSGVSPSYWHMQDMQLHSKHVLYHWTFMFFWEASFQPSLCCVYYRMEMSSVWWRGVHRCHAPTPMCCLETAAHSVPVRTCKCETLSAVTVQWMVFKVEVKWKMPF